MTKLIEETKLGASNSQTTEYLVYYFFGALEILLAFRLVLKLAGASMYSEFVKMVYGVTGIFRRAFSQGVETSSVLEPATIVALIFYAIIAWGIVKLVRISSGGKQPE